MTDVICKNTAVSILRVRSTHKPLFLKNCFTHFSSFPIVDFEQVNVCWENYLTLCSLDICVNVSTGGTQSLTRSNSGNSVVFLISHTQREM